MFDWLTFLPFLGAVIAVALSGALFMPGEWYKTLDKPSWTPPDWAFGPAWTVLYLMIAVAGWLVWQRAGATWVVGVWCLNLVFNAAWSWLMFGRRRIDLALVDAVLMLGTIMLFIMGSAPISRTATWLFVPYLAWVSFATALNYAILQRNPHVARSQMDGSGR
jgi:tryptophan-rich sensory protein